MGHFILLGVCILTISPYLNRTVKSLYEKREESVVNLYINISPDNGWSHCLSHYTIREVRAAEARCGDLEKIALSYHLESHLHIPFYSSYQLMI